MIKTRPELDMKSRVPSSYLDDLHFYRARIYDNCKVEDDRLQVRIMPYMADIPDSEANLLPKYSPFFKGQVIRGYSEVDCKGNEEMEKKISYVWVVATPDFTYGFVLGLANRFDSISKSPMTDSWNYAQIKQSLQRSGAISETFDYNNIAVDFCNPGASMIQLRNIEAGEIWWVTATGSCITLQPDKVYISAREGNESGSLMSSISLTPNKITIKSDVVDINGKYIFMGKHALNLLGTHCGTAETYNGMNLQPVSNIFV